MSGVVSIAPLSPADFSIVAQWLSESTNNEWLTSDWRDKRVDPTLIAVSVRNRRNRLYLVRYDGQPCGIVALADLDLIDRTDMIWYVLGDKKSAGKGITTCALRKLLLVAFGELQLGSVHAWIMEGNIASRCVLEKAGFRQAGRLRSAAIHEGRLVDRVYFDMTRSEVHLPA